MTVSVIVTAITDSITGILSGLGSGMVSFFETIFTNEAGTGLSTLAIVGLAMLGLGVGLGLVNMLVNKIRG